jgi:hypothetical protein
MDESVKETAMTAFIVSLIVSLIVSSVMIAMYRGTGAAAGARETKSDVLEMLNECDWKTGPSPDGVITCDEKCFSTEKCVLALTRLDDTVSVRDCDQNLHREGSVGSYMCLCCQSW